MNRVDVGNVIYHVINRANARVQIFDAIKGVMQLKGLKGSDPFVQTPLFF